MDIDCTPLCLFAHIQRETVSVNVATCLWRCFVLRIFIPVANWCNRGVDETRSGHRNRSHTHTADLWCISDSESLANGKWKGQIEFEWVWQGAILAYEGSHGSDSTDAVEAKTVRHVVTHLDLCLSILRMTGHSFDDDLVLAKRLQAEFDRDILNNEVKMHQPSQWVCAFGCLVHCGHV